MEVVVINVEDRTASGTNQVRKLRDTGKIPLVLYGGGQESVSLQADYPEIKRHLEHHIRVFKLLKGKEEQAGYMQHVQWDCLTDEPLHIDFQRIDMDKPLKMDIELVLLGHPKGAAAGGRIIRDVQYLHLACLPAHVPEQIELRVNDLEIGDHVLAREIELPEGCTLDMPGDRQILHVTEAAKELEEEEPEVDAPADGAADGAADGGAEGGEKPAE
jgi:large subunit ribosomal protein L25